MDRSIGALFLPEKAVLIYLDDSHSILGYANQEDGELFFET